MRSFVTYDADYNLHDWVDAMASKPQMTWRAITAALPTEYLHDEKKKLLALRLLVDGFAGEEEGLLFCLSGGGVVLLFEGRASGWVESFGRLLSAIDPSLLSSMQLFDLGAEWDGFKAKVATLLPDLSGMVKARPRNTNAPVSLSADKISEIKSLRSGRNKPQVLIVEDDPFTRGLVSTLIQNKCDVITAGTLRQALSLYRQKLPDLVFLDIELPDGSGVDGLKAITDADSDAFVVMLSSHTEKTNIVHCLDNGAKGFVAKPFTRDRIMHHVTLADERKRAHGTLHSA